MTYTDVVGVAVILWILVIWSLPVSPARSYFMGLTFFGLVAYMLGSMAAIRSRDAYEKLRLSAPMGAEVPSVSDRPNDQIPRPPGVPPPRRYQTDPMWPVADLHPDYQASLQRRTALMQFGASSIPEPLDAREGAKADAAQWMTHDRDWVLPLQRSK